MLPGNLELIIILLIALVLFGSRLPKIAQSLGKSIQSFRDGLSGIDPDAPQQKDDPVKTVNLTDPSGNAAASNTQTPSDPNKPQA